MGAWGLGPLENDDALDWIGEVSSVDDVEKALLAIVAHEDPDAEACSHGLAACFLVASVSGSSQSVVELPESLASSGRELSGLQSAAIDVVQRLLNGQSETRSLVEAEDLFEDWVEVLEGVLRSLGG